MEFQVWARAGGNGRYRYETQVSGPSGDKGQQALENFLNGKQDPSWFDCTYLLIGLSTSGGTPSHVNEWKVRPPSRPRYELVHVT